MNIIIERRFKKATYTIGNLYVDGRFLCNTLEDKDRGLTDDMTLEEIKARKVYGKTAIPYGTYTVTYTLSPKFGRLLPLVNSVKGFSGIRIHEGNTDADTLGCILVGKNDVKGQVTNSRNTMSKLNGLIKNALSNNEEITLTIR